MSTVTKKIRFAQIMAQVSEGLLTTYAAATKQASFTLEGRALVNRVYQIAGKVFNMKTGYAPDIRIDGVKSGFELTSLSNDNIEIAAGVANVTGVQVTSSGDATNAVTRPGASKYAVYAVTVSSAGTLAITKGTDGDALDLTGGYGSAGQKPYVDGVVVLGYFWAYSDTAGVIPSSQFLPGESANLEYRLIPARGAICLYQALELNRTGGISRPVYIQYRDIAAAGVIQVIGKVEDATLTIIKDDPVETPNHGTLWAERESVGTMDWNLTVKRWRPDEYWIEKMIDPNQDNFFLRIKEDESDTHRFAGFGILHGSMPLSTARGPRSETLNFSGNGELVKEAA